MKQLHLPSIKEQTLFNIGGQGVVAIMKVHQRVSSYKTDAGRCYYLLSGNYYHGSPPTFRTGTNFL